MTRPEPLVQELRVGALRCVALQAGGQKLDGGAMFGVVPKTLWSKRIPADDRNRIPLGMRCLLVDHPDGLVLIDTGSGNKENEKFHDIYGIENEGAGGRTALEDAIRAAGFTPDDVAVVVNTHLHFDHAGGNTYLEGGELRVSFQRAEYVVQRAELDFARRANERTMASYFERNYAPVSEAGKQRLVDGELELLSGVRLIPTPGHTPGHQSVLITSGDEAAFYAGDLVPTAAHLPLPWIMGYDVEPLVTLETKRTILARARDERWTVIFEHDATHAWGPVDHDGKSYRLVTEVADH